MELDEAPPTTVGAHREPFGVSLRVICVICVICGKSSAPGLGHSRRSRIPPPPGLKRGRYGTRPSPHLRELNLVPLRPLCALCALCGESSETASGTDVRIRLPPHLRESNLIPLRPLCVLRVLCGESSEKVHRSLGLRTPARDRRPPINIVLFARPSRSLRLRVTPCRGVFNDRGSGTGPTVAANP